MIALDFQQGGKGKERDFGGETKMVLERDSDGEMETKEMGGLDKGLKQMGAQETKRARE